VATRTDDRPLTRWRRVAMLTAGLAAATTAVSCSGSAKPTGSSGSTVRRELTYGSILSPPTLNPANGDPAYTAIYQWAYDPLVILQSDGTYAPGLATKWGYVGKGNKTYELTLRDGVKFSDGAALDAQAVKTYLDYVKTQKTGSVAGLAANITSVTVTGPQTLRIALSQPDPSLTFYFAQSFGLGDIASPKAVANPKTLDSGTAGAGPYTLDVSKTVANDHYTFVQTPNYWDKSRQHWQTVTVRVIPNASSMIQAMQAGQVQAASGDATTLQAARAAQLTVMAPPQSLTGLNLLDRAGKVAKPLADVRVRQALNLAVDRPAIAQALYGDKNLALSQYALKGQPGYDEKLDGVYPHDVAKAKQLLADAGYPHGFTLSVLSANLVGLDKVVQAIGGQLQDIGVTLKVDSKATANDYLTSMVSGKYPVAGITYGLATLGTLYVGVVNPKGPFNPFHIADPKLTALYGTYFAAGPDESNSAAQKVNAYLVDQAWTVPVVGAPLSYYTAKGITGLNATSGNAGVPALADVRPAG